MKKLRIKVKEVTAFNTTVYLLQVIEQTHISYGFGNNNTNSFKASNDINLISCDYPVLPCDNYKYIYVQGIDVAKNKDIMFTTDKERIEKLKVAVKEYNDFFRAKKPESKIAKGEFIIE